ncbi:MAG TPA: hypothetical protein VG323_17925 [Thermoanaerobaculia bacterium]|nr:hypothetical protein [Thermoanaerobaculia bacterium]
MTFSLTLLFSNSALAQNNPADDLARRAIDALGGPAALEKARYFDFTFTVQHGNERVTSFPQRWDRLTGEYRVSGRDPKRNDFVVIMNVKTRKGRAWLNGEEVHDSRLTDTLDLAYRCFSNDTLWLMMPLRMLDPGVRRETVGDRSDSCGRTWDVVKLTIEGDTHWAWINRDTGIVEEWDMHLQNASADEPPVQVMFHDFARYGGLWISTRREVRNKNQTVVLENLKVASEVAKGAFAK